MIEHYSKNIQNIIQRELFNSKNSIKVVVAWFTNNLLFQPLLLKLQSGVSVELILNRDDINLSTDNEIDFDLFVQYGGRIHWNTTSKLMHDKFCIIDDVIVISGSYNWTNKAELNDESITLFREENSTTLFYNDLFERLAIQYPVCFGDNSYNARRELCPMKQRPYNKLNFYNSVEIRYTPNHVFIFANEYDGGLYALLDNSSFLPKTDYMFREIPKYRSICDKNKNETIWIRGETAWGLFDCVKLEYIILPQFDDVNACDKFPDCYFVDKNGKYGAYNSKGQILLRCEYDELKDLDWTGIRTKKGEKFGLLYDCGRTRNIIPCDYDEIRYLDNNYSFILKRDNKWAITYQGELLCAPIYEEYAHEYSFNQRDSVIVKHNGKYGLYYKNKLVINCEYDELKIETPMIHNGKYGMFSSDGTKVLDFIYDKIEKRHREYYYVVKGMKHGVFTVKTNRVTIWFDTELEAVRFIDTITTPIPQFTYKNFF